MILKKTNLICVTVSITLLTSIAIADSSTELNVPDEYKTIQDAIDAVKNNKTNLRDIVVEPGEYKVNLSLPNGITLRGRETMRTFLIASDPSKPTIEIKGIAGTNKVLNFTFIDTNSAYVSPKTAINIIDSKAVFIENNVFYMGTANNAIVIDASSPISIINNTFYKNNEAVYAPNNENLIVKNNIFARNINYARFENLKPTLSHSCLFENKGQNESGDYYVSGEVKFVNEPGDDPTTGDFHLQEGSPCIHTGDAKILNSFDGENSDFGAFGGKSQDGYLMPPVFTASSPKDLGSGKYQVTIDWTGHENKSYLVASQLTPGYYKVFYDTQRIIPFSSDKSPKSIEVKDGSTSIEINDIELGSISIAAPEITSVKPSNKTLDISWTAINGATSYIVHYGINSSSENTTDPIDGTSYTLSGLSNDTAYFVSVEAIRKSYYYFIVKAYSANDKYSSYDDTKLEQPLKIGDDAKSGPSNVATGIPEVVQPYPTLPNEGCFIATAAFGYYSAPEVQVLRQFRDQILLPTASGRWLVKKYYTFSPPVADWIRQHEWSKSVVRAMLWPLIHLSSFALSDDTETGFGYFGIALLLPVLGVSLIKHFRNRAIRK